MGNDLCPSAVNTAGTRKDSFEESETWTGHHSLCRSLALIGLVSPLMV